MHSERNQSKGYLSHHNLIILVINISTGKFRIVFLILFPFPHCPKSKLPWPRCVVRDCRQITFVMLNALSPSLALKGQDQPGWNPMQNYMKNTCLLVHCISSFESTSYKKKYKIQLPVPLHPAFTSVDINFCNFLEPHSTFSEKGFLPQVFLF